MSYKYSPPNLIRSVDEKLVTLRIPPLQGTDHEQVASKRAIAKKLGCRISELNERKLMEFMLRLEEGADIKAAGPNSWIAIVDGVPKRLSKILSNRAFVYVADFKPAGIQSRPPTLEHRLDYHSQVTTRRPDWSGSRSKALRAWANDYPDLKRVKDRDVSTEKEAENEERDNDLEEKAGHDPDKEAYRRFVAPWALALSRATAQDLADPILRKDPELHKGNFIHLHEALTQWKEVGYQGGDYLRGAITNRLIEPVYSYHRDLEIARPPRYNPQKREGESLSTELMATIAAQNENESSVYYSEEDFKAAALLFNSVAILNAAAKAGIEESIPTTYPGIPMEITEERLIDAAGPWPGPGKKELIYSHSNSICVDVQWDPRKGQGKRALRNEEARCYTLEKAYEGTRIGKAVLTAEEYELMRLKCFPLLDLATPDDPDRKGRYVGYDRSKKTYEYVVEKGEGRTEKLEVDKNIHSDFKKQNKGLTSRNKRGVITPLIQSFFDNLPDTYRDAIQGKEDAERIKNAVRKAIEPTYAKAIEKITDPKLSPQEQQEVMLHEMHLLFSPLKNEQAVAEKEGFAAQRLAEQIEDMIVEKAAAEIEANEFTEYHLGLMQARNDQNSPFAAIWKATQDPEAPNHSEAEFIFRGVPDSLPAKFSRVLSSFAKAEILKELIPEDTLVIRKNLAEAHFREHGYAGLIPEKHFEDLEIDPASPDAREKYITGLKNKLVSEMLEEAHIVAQVVKGEQLPPLRSLKDAMHFIHPKMVQSLAVERLDRALDNFSLQKETLPYATSIYGDPSNKYNRPLSLSRVNSKPMRQFTRQSYLPEEEWNQTEPMAKYIAAEKVEKSSLSPQQKDLLHTLESLKNDEANYALAELPPYETLLAGIKLHAGMEIEDPIERECIDVLGKEQITAPFKELSAEDVRAVLVELTGRELPEPLELSR